MAGGIASRPAQAVPDVLERPALIIKDTGHSAMLAVTRAGNRLVAAGERGRVLYSDDNGATWKQAQVPVSVSLTNIFFINAQKGWAIGHSGVVLATQNGGETWTRQLDGRQAAKLMLDAAERKTGGDDTTAARQLADARQMVDDGPDKPFLDLYFSDENAGYVVGAYGLIFRTEDGGKNWTPWQSHVENPRGKHLHAIRSSGPALYIAGEQGAILRSTDAGEHFTEVKTPYPGSYFGIILEADGGLVAYGLRGNIYRSEDAGKNWQKIAVDTSSLLAADASLADGTLLIAGHEGDIFRSTDGGRSFSLLNIDQRSPFTGITVAADGSIILSGMRGITRLRSTTSQAQK